MIVEHLKTDILILGAGGAGLFAALHALKANPDLDITIVSKGLLGKCGCTRMVQGGYNVALNPGDSIERHFMDTIEGGKWLPHQELAWTLVTKAIERVQELENEIGCFFDRNSDGTLHGKAFAGQTFDRTVHKGDLTGIEIINRLMEQVWARPIRRLEEYRAVALIPAKNGALSGVLLIDVRSGEFRFVAAQAVLLATGGGPTMYRYHTPSGDKSMDGLAMALRLGLPLRDMEMVQFHPTGLLAGPDTRMTGTVLEEGLRGSGGHLLNGAMHRFMGDYDPKLERATRDVVSRAIYAEMRAGRTTRNGGVYIKMSHLGPAKVAKEFKGMVDRCRDCGFDLAGGLVEVVPTAHYFMGGVVCEVDTATERFGLFVAGEDASGMHGANRLGGNGVANSTVFGGIAGDVMPRWIAANPGHREPDADVLDAEFSRARHPFAQKQKPGDLNALRETLLDTMWDEVGVVRDRASIERGLAALDHIEMELLAIGVADADRRFNLTWHDWLNLRSLCEVSRVIALAALKRENSRGAHFPVRFSGARRLRHFDIHGSAARRERDRDRRKPGAVYSCEAGRDAAARSYCSRIETNMIPLSSIQRTAEDLMAKAAIEIPDDYLDGLRRCVDTEKGDLSAFVIKAMLENYEAAKEDRRAMCGDTGLPRWYVKIGNEAMIEGGPVALEAALRRATARATTTVPLRPNRVHPLWRTDHNNNVGIGAPEIEYAFHPDADWIELTTVHKGGLFGSDYRMLFPGDGIEGIKRFYLDTLIGFGKRGLACQPAIVGVGLGGSKDTSMVLGKQASCLRVVGSRNPDPKIAALEEEFKELGNTIGMGAMGFVGSSMVIDCHIEVGYCHTGGMPMSVHMFCLSSRRACARIATDGKATFRTDPMWFTDYMRRETVEWGQQAAEAAE